MTKNFFSMMLIAIVFAVSFIGTGCPQAQADRHSKLVDRTKVISNGFDVTGRNDWTGERDAVIAAVQNAGFNEGLPSTADFDLGVNFTKDASQGVLVTGRTQKGEDNIDTIKKMQPELQAEIKKIVAAMKVVSLATPNKP